MTFAHCRSLHSAACLPGVVERDDAMGDRACGGGVVLVGIGRVGQHGEGSGQRQQGARQEVGKAGVGSTCRRRTIPRCSGQRFCQRLRDLLGDTGASPFFSSGGGC